MRSVIYTRQSLALHGDDLAVARQEAECLKLAERRGWGKPEVFCDNSYSASKPDSRPAYKRLLRLMADRQVNNVIILRIDRLMRLNDELEELIKLSEGTGVRVTTVEGDIDLSTTQGRLIARILVSVARNEVEVKSERHKLSNVQRAVAGLPHKGRRAFGYELDGMTIKEDEAALLRSVAEKFLSGWTYNELAYWLNAEGHTTVTGKPFYSVAVRQLLMRKRYGGIREHDGVEYPAAWTPVFDADTYNRIQYTVRERSEKNGNKPAPRKYLLTGLLECGACGATMNGSTAKSRQTGETYPVYRCNRNRTAANGEDGCGKVSRGARPLEHFIREVLVYRLDTEELARLLEGEGEDITPLLGEREALMSRQDELTDMLAVGDMDRAAYKRASERVRARLSDVEGKIGELHRARFNVSLRAGETVATRWDVEADGWRRSLMELLIERILILPSAKKPRYKVDGKTFYFDVNSVEIDWLA